MNAVLYFIEALFASLCGWVGHITVKAVTFGKVDLDWDGSSESAIAEAIGGGVLIALAMLIPTLIGSG